MPQSDDFLDRFPALRRLAWVRGRHRIPVIRQLASTDCGAAALAMVLGYHGRYVTLDEIRKRLGIGRDGSNAAALLRIGNAFGLRGRGIRLEMEDLGSLPAGAILYWEFSHYVVFEKLRGDRVEIVDPASGRRVLPIAAFRKSFTGVALVFERTETFAPKAGKSGRISGLLREMTRRKGLLARIISTSLLIQILSAAMPLLTAVLIDDVVPRKDYSLLLTLAAGYTLFQLFYILAGFVRAHLLIHLRTRVEVDFTLRFVDHLVDLPYSFFQQHTSGDLMVRMGSNNTIRDILTSTVLSTLVDATTASIYLVLLLLTSPRLAIAVIFFAAARIALVAVIRWRQRILLRESLENQARSQTYQVEMLSGMETLKSMGLEHRSAETWSNVFIDGLNITVARGRLDAVFSGLTSVLSTVSTLVLMFYGTYNVLNGALTLGSMMAFNAMAANFLGPMDSLASSALQLQMLDVYLERLNDVMDAAPEQDKRLVEPAGVLTGAIALETVSFRYSGDGPDVVSDISVDIPAGSRIALVGRTGSGKSTLARLIAGLYDPRTGRIRFDGKDLKTLDLQSVRSQLGIVTQDTQLFGGSIRANIALSDPRMPLDRVVRAARCACIHDEIVAMPMGYETPLADRGLSLSGGQRQRLAIARALAGNPRLMVLDEATSHLDAVTERKVNDNIASLKCTRVVVAHRLSTIVDADLIVVLDSGKIVERGTHQDLLTADRQYAALVLSQREARHYSGRFA